MRKLILLAFLFTASLSQGQVNTISFQRFETLELEKSVSSIDSMQHTAMKPFNEKDWTTDSVFGYYDERKYYYAFGRKFLRDNLVEVKGEDFHFTFNPLWDLQLGLDAADTTNYKDSVRLFNNTRGLIITGDIGDKLSFQTSVYENQARYPLAYQSLVDSLQVVPGQGRWKFNQSAGWDFSSAYGLISYQVKPWLNVQLGHGKHFIGNGYRSMLLSDNAFNYPYLKGTFDLLDDKIKYVWMYANFQVLERLPIGDVPEALFRRKGGSFYFLNYNPDPRIEIGLYEAIIWNEWNDTSGTLPFNYQRLIPIIGANSLIEKNDSLHHGFLGVNLNLKVHDQVQVYGQYMSDFNGDSDFGYQFGIKGFDLFLKNLDFQMEYNSATSGAYMNSSKQEDYQHLNQSMAHPLSHDFDEVIAIVNYRNQRVFGQAKGHLQNKISESGFEINRNTQILDLQAGIFLNPKTNMNFAVGWIFRDLKDDFSSQKTQWIYFSFKTSLWNKYYDF